MGNDWNWKKQNKSFINIYLIFKKKNQIIHLSSELFLYKINSTLLKNNNT